MFQEIFIFVIKIAFGVTLGLMGAYKPKKNKMRIFDTLTADCKIDILEAAMSYAKADIAEKSLSVDPIMHACGFGEMFFLQAADFALIDPVTVVAFVGPRPPHRPKIW